MAEKRLRLFVLGAGFSRAAGFPLADMLWRDILKIVDSRSKGIYNVFRDDLKEYIEYNERCGIQGSSKEQIDYEKFMSYLDIEHYLGLRGPDTLSDDGNESTVIVKTLIGHLLSASHSMLSEIPPLYKEFAEQLQPSDYVLTFNYDVLLERALNVVDKPYRLFPHRYESVSNDSATLDLSHDEIVILKLHGSIDWFDRTSYERRLEKFKKSGLPRKPAHPIFNHVKELGVMKLTEGPRYEDDHLAKIYRVENIEELYGRETMLSVTPVILPPSSMKILYAKKMLEFWYGLNGAGTENFGLNIIGYSLPDQDEYVKQALYKMVRNYQEVHYWETKVMRKAPMVIVDKLDDCKSIKNFKKKYQFVDWNRAILHSDGFDKRALELIFNNT